MYWVILLRGCHRIHSGPRAAGSWDRLSVVEWVSLSLSFHVIKRRDLYHGSRALINLILIRLQRSKKHISTRSCVEYGSTWDVLLLEPVEWLAAILLRRRSMVNSPNFRQTAVRIPSPRPDRPQRLRGRPSRGCSTGEGCHSQARAAPRDDPGHRGAALASGWDLARF